jgi:hypothetical protein
MGVMDQIKRKCVEKGQNGRDEVSLISEAQRMDVNRKRTTMSMWFDRVRSNRVCLQAAEELRADFDSGKMDQLTTSNKSQINILLAEITTNAKGGDDGDGESHVSESGRQIFTARLKLNDCEQILKDSKFVVQRKRKLDDGTSGGQPGPGGGAASTRVRDGPAQSFTLPTMFPVGGGQYACGPEYRSGLGNGMPSVDGRPQQVTVQYSQFDGSGFGEGAPCRIGESSPYNAWLNHQNRGGGNPAQLLSCSSGFSPAPPHNHHTGNPPSFRSPSRLFLFPSPHL